MIQAQFPRLKDPFLSESRGERRVILTLMTQLYNSNVLRVGINKILNVYMNEANGNYSYFGIEMVYENAI